MTQLHPYDEEGKERVRHIANYIAEFFELDFPLDGYEQEEVHDLIRTSVRSDDYLMDEYGYANAEQLVYNRLEQIA